MELSECTREAFWRCRKKITCFANRAHDRQFQSLSTDAAGDLMGGTQDNGTFAYKAGQQSSWFESIFGDGGQSGFDATKPAQIRVHTYFAATPDVNFHGTSSLNWDWIGDPLQGETPSFYVPLITDPVLHGYVWTGMQHVWRTPDDGGSQAFLDQHCNEFNYAGDATCGDWLPLGSSTPTGDANDAGDLTGTFFGTDRAGEFITRLMRRRRLEHPVGSYPDRSSVRVDERQDCCRFRAVHPHRHPTDARPVREWHPLILGNRRGPRLGVLLRLHGVRTWWPRL